MSAIAVLSLSLSLLRKSYLVMAFLLFAHDYELVVNEWIANDRISSNESENERIDRNGQSRRGL
jgi:hypothetical protein